MGRSRNQGRDRDSDRAAGQWSCDLLRLRQAGTGLRPSATPSVRVCAAVANRGVLCLRDATCELSAVRRESRAGSVVRRQESLDDDLPLVSGRLGQASFVERRGRRIWHDVAECVSFGKTRSFVGIDAPQPRWHRVDRRRRSAVAKGSQVPDAGPCSDRKRADRRRIEATLMDRQESHNQDLFAILPDVGQRAIEPTEVRVQRHVEAVSESDCQESRRCDPCTRPIPHHAENATYR